MRLDFPIYPGRANSVKLILTVSGDSINHAAITRLGVYVGHTLIDSSVKPELFALGLTDHVEIKLGSASPALTVGRYTCRLIVYDAGQYAGGYVWPEEFVVNVQALV